MSEFKLKDAKQLSAGSESICTMKQGIQRILINCFYYIWSDCIVEDSSNGSIAGIVLGSISLAFVCIFGILVILYCCTRSERPLDNNLTTSITYNYSYVGSQGDDCVKEEQEEEFNDSDASCNSYQPPTPLVEKQWQLWKTIYEGLLLYKSIHLLYKVNLFVNCKHFAHYS